MYRKLPGNPKVQELNKSYKERSYNLSSLHAISKEEEIVAGVKKRVRYCAWCAEGKLTHGNQKYCTPECSSSAMAWAYPQKEDALKLLLMAQEWKCKLCSYDYRPAMDAIIAKDKARYGGEYSIEQVPWYYLKRLKERVPKENRPEVDHILPIYKGGQSIGLENHQAICYTCHKNKTGKDLSGKRK
jgi:5-methylcytosine-specific restriction endonuclease McrA